MRREVKNWGNYPVTEAEIKSFDDLNQLRSHLSNFDQCIVRGKGRCYGDSSIADNVISSLRYRKILDFDKENGIFECQSGATLDEILQIIVPSGWFLPVTPGTKFVTAGGAVASDIHGKNHHKDGSFSNHILNISLIDGDGKQWDCSKESNPDLFEATCGGMGLTGVIVSVRFKLKKIETAYIAQRTIKTKNLEETLQLFNVHSDYTYSVAWIDCLKSGRQMGRSLIFLGEHAKAEELKGKQSKDPFRVHSSSKLKVPFNFPSFVLNSLTVKLFNTLYYHKVMSRDSTHIAHYDPYFYPLDNILDWNRIYGKRGFLQYQFVVPLDAQEGLKKIIEFISAKKLGSFLSVLKQFGPQDDLISFPMSGYTLAIDFPRTRSIIDTLDEIDAMVLENGGRLYLTKDARMASETFLDSYPKVGRFQSLLKKYDPETKFRSIQSNRLKINI